MDGEEAEERLSKKSKTRTGQDGIDGLYHGAGGYNTYIQPKEVMNSKVRAGPIKATSSIRTVTTTDYQPDVCKDYKGEAHPIWLLIPDDCQLSKICLGRY